MIVIALFEEGTMEAERAHNLMEPVFFFCHDDQG